MRWRAAALVVLASVGLCAVPAFAQITQGRLTGLVTDTQGAILPGVTVTVTSPALIGTQTTVTQPDGKFMFPALPSGTYKVQFELSGFQKLMRENVQVVLGQTISVDAQLPIASLAESVTVTGASPVVDVTTTKVGTDLKGEALVAVPNSTDVWGALSEAPGVRMGGFDVGGSHKSQQSGYEVFGINSQARVVSDGIDHTEGVGGTGFYEDYYANEEVSVSALGSDVEMNSGGAAIVTTIKSGGNVFKGLEHLSYEPGSFVGKNAAPSDMTGRGYVCPSNNGTPTCTNPNLLFWEGHLDLGGPIKRDKAWFYGAYNHFKIDKAVSGISQSVATDLGIFDNYTGKVTAKGGASNTFIGYIQQGRKQKPKRGLSTLVPPESVRAQDSTSRMYKGEWQRVLSNRAFLSVNTGNFTLDWPMVVQVDPAQKPPEVFRATNYVDGAGWIAFSTYRKKPQLKAQSTYYLPGTKAGSHDFKYGFEYLYDSYRYGHNGKSGPIRYSYPCGAPGACSPDRIRFIDTGDPGSYGSDWTVGPNLDTHYAGYVQDRWAPNSRFTVTLGVRLDRQAVGYGEAIRKPLIQDLDNTGARIFPASTTVAAHTFFTNMNVAPRLGVTVDLSGKGTQVLKAFYGRYYNNLADGFSAVNPGGISIAEYFFKDTGDHRYHGPQNLNGIRLRAGADSTPVDPNIKTPWTEEISGSFESQLPGESSVRLTYVRKNTRDIIPVYGSNFVPAYFGKVTVPTKQTYLGVTYNLLDVPAGLSTDAEYTNYPDADGHYDTIEVAYQKRLKAFFIQTSADYQWRNDLRTINGPYGISTSPLSSDPIGVDFQFTPNPNAPNRQKTNTYHFQFLGRYTFKYDVGFAANFRYQSGFPWAPVVPDGVTDPGLNMADFGAPFFTQNLKENRSDNVALLNFRLDKSIPVGARAKITGILDIYNVLNADPVTNFNMNLGPSYKTVIATLDPRVFQVGVRLEF
jgi:hypothetical protein